MLKACLFENGSGLKLWGEPSDLDTLHYTVRKMISVLVDYELSDTAASTLLVDFLEKIEGAYSGKRFKEQTVFRQIDCTCHGFTCSWMEVLMISSLLRLLAEYTITDELDDVNMLLLEHQLRKTLSHPDGGDLSAIHQYIGKPFFCRNIRHFIRHFNFNDADFEGSTEADSLQGAAQYLSAFFEGNKQHN